MGPPSHARTKRTARYLPNVVKPYRPANMPKSLTDRRPTFPKTPFPLMGLPPEIRNMVYKLALESAGAEFLATSRQIHQEARGLVYQYGVLRITEPRLSVFHEVPYGLNEAELDKIQNLSLDLSLEDRLWADNAIVDADTNVYQIWEHNEMGLVNRKTCNITLCADWKLNLDEIPYLCEGFPFLKSFENFNIAIKDKWMRNVRKRSNKTGPGRLYDGLKEEFEQRFGPAIWNDHEKIKERYLEFHPLEHPQKPRAAEDEDGMY